MNQARSAFVNTPLGVQTFTTDFSFQLTAADAEGFTFCIQGVGPTALGRAGGGLGYGADHAGGSGGIPMSVAVKFDLYDNEGEGPDSTGLYVNGAAPTVAGSIDLTGYGIDLHSGDVFNVHMSYDGSTLWETITDASTGASATLAYTIDIPATVGGPIAYAGFTAGTGDLTATQDILNWTYTSDNGGAPPGGAPAADGEAVRRLALPSGSGPLTPGVGGSAWPLTQPVRQAVGPAGPDAAVLGYAGPGLTFDFSLSPWGETCDHQREFSPFGQWLKAGAGRGVGGPWLTNEAGIAPGS
jgi:hypothetical protein